jgi:hypothetical protein
MVKIESGPSDSARAHPSPASRRIKSLWHHDCVYANAEAAGVSLVASEARPGQLPLRRAFCSPPLPALYTGACCGVPPSARFWRNLPAGFIQPCQPTLVANPGWLHEVKHDGFRILARKQGARVEVWPLATSVSGDAMID